MASGQRRPPIITITSVEAALDSLLYTTSDTSAAAALHYLALVDHFLENPEHPSAEPLRQYALRCILNDFIITELSRQRHIFGLPPPQPDTPLSHARQALAGDSQHNSPDLMAWSLLYYRHVRVELNLTQEEIATLTAINPRTLLRYKKYAVDRLTELLISAEWHIRAQQRQRRLLASLPKFHQPALIGRETALAQLQQVFASQTHPSVFITGRSGVGKTALLQHFVAELIKTNEIDSLIWLENPSSIASIVRELEYRLLPTRSRTTTLRDILLTWRVVIVLDDITAIVNNAVPEEWQALFDTLSFATTLVSSELFRVTRPEVLNIALDNLPWEQTVLFLRQLFAQQDRDETALYDYAAAIWQVTGGNPQGIHLAFAQIEQGNLDFYEQVVLAELYAGIYQRLDADSRQLWHIFSVLSEGHLSAEQIQTLAFAHVMPILLAARLIEPVESLPKNYGMTQPARQFVRLAYPRQPEMQMAFEQLIAAHTDMPVWFVEMLLAADWLNIAPEICLAMLHRHWREGVKSGQPVRWRHILEKYLGLLDTALRLAYAICLRRTGDWAAAEQVLAHCLSASGKHGDFLLQADIMIEVAVLHRQRGEYQKAQQLLQRASLQSRSQQDRQQRIALEQAQIAIDSSNRASAQHYLQLLPEDEATRLLYAELHLLSREFEACRRLAQTVLAQTSETMRTQAAAHTILGRSYQMQNRLDLAIEHLDAARILFERAGDVFAAARAQSNLAAALLTLQKWDDAEHLLAQAYSLQSQLKDIVGYNATQINLNLLTQQRLLTSTHEETAE